MLIAGVRGVYKSSFVANDATVALVGFFGRVECRGKRNWQVLIDWSAL